jgi:hypothetical protein
MTTATITANRITKLIQPIIGTSIQAMFDSADGFIASDITISDGSEGEKENN